MSVAIVSAGRSGTNMVLTILETYREFTPTDPPEDKFLFTRYNTVYPKNFLTKSDTTYCRSYEQFRLLMHNNPSMKIVWTIRDPRDMCLSKIKRGWDRQSDDATFSGCLADMYHMMDLHQRISENFPDRIYTIPMENIILDTERAIYELCEWLEIPYDEEMKYFYKRTRHVGKRERYKKIDKNQVRMYQNFEYLDEIYQKTKIRTGSLFMYIQPIIVYFGYLEV